jgi:integrase
VDLIRRRLAVRKNAVRVGGKILLGTPKSHEARTVPFPPFLTERLALLCTDNTPDQVLFGNGLSHQRTPSTRDGWLVYALKRAREVDPTFPRVTPHDLRHTAASLAVSAGANVKALQRMLGHASAAMALDVSADLFDDDLDSVAVALDQARMISGVGKVWANRASDTPVATLKPRSA